MRVAHITSVHSRSDARIFAKECRGLAAAGWRVDLLVADGLPDESIDGVTVRSVPKPKRRLARISKTIWALMRLAIRGDYRICHIHDPELLLLGLALKRRGVMVIFDSHEDVPKQILGKSYIPPLLRRPIAVAYAAFERAACARMDAIVAATPAISAKFEGMALRVCNVNNYPSFLDLDVFDSGGGSTESRSSDVCYIGGISRDRGIVELVGAMMLVRRGVRLLLAGKFMDRGLEDEVRGHDGWKQVVYSGWVDRQGINDVLSVASVGVVTLHPTPAYIESLPVKMFEYMAAGIPVIASSFPLWQEIIEGEYCGRCVDPTDPAAIAEAVDFFVENPDEARRMGENGRRAVRERYNWAAEEKKLLSLYRELCTWEEA